MSRDEEARVALRRLARGNDAVPGPGRSRPEWTDRPGPTETEPSSSDDHRAGTGSSSVDEPSRETGQERSSDGEAVEDVVPRAVRAVSDLDAAVRFVEDGGVEALAGVLAERRRAGRDARTDEGTASLRAFCAFERAAAGGGPARSGSVPPSATVEPADWSGEERPVGSGPLDRRATFAADSPHL